MDSIFPQARKIELVKLKLEKGIGFKANQMEFQQRQKSDKETCNTEFDEKLALDFQKVLQRHISPNPNLGRTAMLRTYSKDIVPKAHFNSVRFFCITMTE